MSTSFDDVTPVSAVIKPTLIVDAVTPGALAVFDPDDPDDPPAVVAEPAPLVGDTPVVAELLPLLLDPHATNNKLPAMIETTPIFVRCFIVQSPIQLEVTATNPRGMSIYSQSSDLVIKTRPHKSTHRFATERLGPSTPTRWAAGG